MFCVGGYVLCCPCLSDGITVVSVVVLLLSVTVRCYNTLCLWLCYFCLCLPGAVGLTYAVVLLLSMAVRWYYCCICVCAITVCGFQVLCFLSLLLLLLLL